MKQHNKRILLFTDWYFPGYKAGGPIQSCRNLVSSLKDEFLFYIFTSDTDLGETISYSNIKSDQWYEERAGEKIYYAKSGTVTITLIKEIVQEVKPDIIYFNSMFSVKYTLLPLFFLRSLRFKEKKIVLAPRGMLHSGALSLKSKKKKVFITFFRLLRFHKRIYFHATDVREIQDIQLAFPGSKILLAENIPNVNIEFQNGSIKKSGFLKLIFFSRVHSKKNLPFVLDILGRNHFDGEIILDVYGDAESPSYLEKCIQMSKDLPANIKVDFLGGALNESIVKKMAFYDVFILPTLGENFGHVIFESLMSGVPVLLSDQTPWRNLAVLKAGWDIPLSQQAVFIEKIKELIVMDQAVHMQWRRGARKLAEDYLQNIDFRNKYNKLFN